MFTFIAFGVLLYRVFTIFIFVFLGGLLLLCDNLRVVVEAVVAAKLFRLVIDLCLYDGLQMSKICGSELTFLGLLHFQHEVVVSAVDASILQHSLLKKSLKLLLGKFTLVEVLRSISAILSREEVQSCTKGDSSRPNKSILDVAAILLSRHI